MQSHCTKSGPGSVPCTHQPVTIVQACRIILHSPGRTNYHCTGNASREDFPIGRPPPSDAIYREDPRGMAMQPTGCIEGYVDEATIYIEDKKRKKAQSNRLYRQRKKVQMLTPKKKNEEENEEENLKLGTLPTPTPLFEAELPIPAPPPPTESPTEIMHNAHNKNIKQQNINEEDTLKNSIHFCNFVDIPKTLPAKHFQNVQADDLIITGPGVHGTGAFATRRLFPNTEITAAGKFVRKRDPNCPHTIDWVTKKCPNGGIAPKTPVEPLWFMNSGLQNGSSGVDVTPSVNLWVTYKGVIGVVNREIPPYEELIGDYEWSDDSLLK